MTAARDILRSTKAYERWLAKRTALVRKDLRAKHDAMRQSPFVFLRATFYRWAEVWPTICEDLRDAPTVVGVGDLHLENFGTWRDREGRLVWGVNDFDEAYPLPYTNDVVRLATSAVLAASQHHMTLSAGAVCDAILSGYTTSMTQGGQPIVLAERHRWLQSLAGLQLQHPKRFWKKLSAGKDATAPVPYSALRGTLGTLLSHARIIERQAGVGSLGRRRVVALAQSEGAWVAREAKALVASAVAFTTNDRSNRIYAAELVQRAIRSPDPFYQILKRWIVRRLAPDCTKIEVADLARSQDQAKLLRAMGWETANIHVRRARSTIIRDLERRPKRWLERAAADMADVVTQDWRTWRRR